MDNSELTKNVMELREFEAKAYERFKTLFDRVDKQDGIIDSLRSMSASIGSLDDAQKRIDSNMKVIRQDVDEIKSAPGKKWEKAIWLFYAAVAGEVIIRVFDIFKAGGGV